MQIMLKAEANFSGACVFVCVSVYKAIMNIAAN